MKILTTLALTLLLPLVAHADGKKMKGLMCSKESPEAIQKKMFDHEDKFLKKIDLTKEQKDKVNQARAARGAKINSLILEIRAAHTEMMAALEKDASREELRAKHVALHEKKAALMHEKAEGMLDIRDVLTPEQRRKALLRLQDKKEDLCD